MRVVVALGGNALLRRGEPADAEAQRRNVVAAVRAMARIAAEHEIVLTHGNGPRVGLAPGSMAPKIEAACLFVERTGAEAAIGSLAHAATVLAGDAGTRIH